MTMIRSWAAGLALTVGCVAAALAQLTGGLSPREFFELFDANKDKMIDASEVPDSARAAFERLLKSGDLNKNGRLEMSEYTALLASAGNRGAGNPAPAASAAPVDRAFAERFAVADRNGDGKISKEEWPGRPDAFAQADADKDGFVSRDEASKFFAQQGTGGAAAVIRERVKAMDKNGDGKITREEFTGPEVAFVRIDTNGDGVISKDELEKFRPGGLGPDRFKELDKNGDGKLTRDEFDGPPVVFDRLDADNDGTITLQELRAAMQGAAKKTPEKKDAQ